MACGGGGGVQGEGTSDGSIVGLEIPSRISFVEAKDISTPSTSVKKGMTATASKAITSDRLTPYYTDPLEIYVSDDSLGSVEIINEILCMLHQTKYREMVNQGHYIALVSETKCSRSNGQSQNAGGERMMVWVINSSRADNDSPHIVMAWIREEGDAYESPKVIHAKAVIDEGISDVSLFGDFRLDFEFWDAAEQVRQGRGYLKTVKADRVGGREGAMFSMVKEPQSSEREASHMVLDVGGKSGQAYSLRRGDGEEGQSRAFQIAFDENVYRTRGTGGGERCLDRQHFDLLATRYGVYHEDGSRYEIENHGFDIRYEDHFYGWASYWGIWLSEDIPLESGMEVTRAGRDAAAGQRYTTFVAPGKLSRHMRHQMTLAEIEGDFLSYGDWSDGKVYRVVWDGNHFMRTHQQHCVEEKPCWWEAVPTAALPLAPYSWVNFWRDGMGNISFVVPAGGVSGTTPITYDQPVVLNPAADEFAGGASFSLKCYSQCPKPNMTGAIFSGQGVNACQGVMNGGMDAFFDPAPNVNAPYLYTIDPSDMTLKYQGQAVAPAPGMPLPRGRDRGSIISGAMVPLSTPLGNVWDAWNEDLYYTWETGLQRWNQFSGLIDESGAFVNFDPPLQMDYTHTDGVRYVLEYAGFGYLQNIPWAEDEGSGRWYPLISIPDGSLLRTFGGEVSYSRTLEMEQRMRPADLSRCRQLAFDNVTPPDQNYVDVDIGTIPAVPADQVVIKGE